MQSRSLILGAALALIALLAIQTVRDTVRNGPTPLGVASLGVLALFAFGIVGALRHPPRQ
jgi:hypothetical protein